MRCLLTCVTGKLGRALAARLRAEGREVVAEAILYLAGADFVTGTSLPVDGGRLVQSGGALRA